MTPDLFSILAGIPPGTDLPDHIADGMIQLGNAPATGPCVRVYLSDAAAQASTPLVLLVRSRADWKMTYRLVRAIRPGGCGNGGLLGRPVTLWMGDGYAE